MALQLLEKTPGLKFLHILEHEKIHDTGEILLPDTTYTALACLCYRYSSSHPGHSSQAGDW